MEKMFGPAYTGDPGVPHSDRDTFSGIVQGALAFSLLTAVNPYHWHTGGTMFNWHDWAMVCENHRMKRAAKAKKKYEPVWNKMLSDEVRESYYQNWRDHFP
eukprot:SM000131S26690  [mRNA]  locus=s131:10058:10823:- [translate_table: standard]